MGVYTVSADPQSLSELIEKLADGLPQTNTVRRLPAKLVEYVGHCGGSLRETHTVSASTLHYTQ